MSLVFTLIMLYVPICPARQDVGQRYWWLDEMRVVAQSLSKAKTGAVAKWPRMTTPAGSAVLPLPQAAGADSMSEAADCICCDAPDD